MPLVLMILAALALRHPIHSSSAVITADSAAGVASVVLRVFADDFPPGRTAAPAASYLAHRFTIFDRAGRQVPLRVLDVRAEGVVLVLTLTGPVPGGLAGGRVWHGVLAERFPDQVNLVQLRGAGLSGTLLFTTSDGPKRIP